VARHGHDGNGAPMAKRDGFFILMGRRDLGSSPGGLHGMEWRRRARTTAGLRA
jgi:hypothetical protein